MADASTPSTPLAAPPQTPLRAACAALWRLRRAAYDSRRVLVDSTTAVAVTVLVDGVEEREQTLPCWRFGRWCTTLLEFVEADLAEARRSS